MKKFSLLALLAIITMGIAFTSCNSKSSIGSAKMKTKVDSVSYIIGLAQGANIKNQMNAQMEQWPEKGNIDAFLAGFVSGMETGNDSLFLGKDMTEANEYINAFFTSAQQESADKNKADGDRFLSENKAKSGVITTESGLQYTVITEGTGTKPTPEDIITVHYHGTFLDGSIFDSTIDRGEPAQFSVGGVIPGWTEGLQLMNVGSKYKFWIPAELAYGMQPPSPTIPQNAMLVFEVELLEIVK